MTIHVSLVCCCGNLTGGCGTCRGFRVRPPGAMLRRDRHAISGPGMICSSSSNKNNNKRTDSNNNSNKASNTNANSCKGNNSYTNDSNSINKSIECINNNNNCSTTGPVAAPVVWQVW